MTMVVVRTLHWAILIILHRGLLKILHCTLLGILWFGAMSVSTFKARIFFWLAPLKIGVPKFEAVHAWILGIMDLLAAETINVKLTHKRSELRRAHMFGA